MVPEPSRRPDLFALEAGEALQRLARLLGQEGEIGDDAVRSARVLRGASLLGGPPDFTRAAAALEATIKALHDHSLQWQPAVAEVLRGAVEGLEALMRRARAWATADAESALRIAGELDRISGRSGAEPARPFGRRTSDQQEPAVRAFLSREATIVAGAVERLARDPAGLANPAAIENVLRTTQPLRGVAFLGEVPPLGELLEVIELLLHGALRGAPPAPRTSEALSQLAGSMTRAARDLTDRGSPNLDAPELSGAATRARDVAADERDIISIEGLFADGDSAPIVHRGTPPPQEMPGADAAIALHALAGRLGQAADQLEQARTGAVALLRQTALLLHLRAGLPARPSLPTDRLIAAMGRALARGAAEADLAGFAAALRQATAALRGQAGDQFDSAPPSVAMVTGLFETLPGADREADDIVPIATLLADSAPDGDQGVVPIESLLLTEAPALAAARPVPTNGLDLLEGSLGVYEALVAGIPLAPNPSAPSRPARPTAPVAGGDGAVVPIESLLYRGRGALERAAEVRREIEETIAAMRAERRLEPMFRELMDLIPLALDDAR
jgi:hypothetical protein